ncbi:cytochrome c oxidase assembly protein [Pseudonocardia broussonetiae]|uniref:Cytochrome c oxidase assembly protein n=1 Tax=Pseudonocardia broussonetiae TaxID=2736640 RepID=A0A6M6JN16_9PSEU|nr:cytochrome c oxidase assembly protein [Pseudonocardia broussonetiae]QJY47829.1 cytochrome c oxidase assembly protein [Pseudonocardia broussonetiae]
MLATIGLAVGLGRTPPPAPGEAGEPSRTGEELGYELTGPPSGVGGLLVDARPDLVLGAVVAVLLVTYLAGVRRLRAGGGTWPLRRSSAWLAGCAVVLVATSSGLGRYGAAMLSVGVAAQVLLTLVAPMLLVLGAPLALVRRVLPDGQVSRLLAHPVLAALGRPVPAVAVFATAMAVLYGFGLIEPLLVSQPGRLTLDVLLLLAGVVLVGALTSGDPARARAVAVLVVAQAGVGIGLLLRSEPIAGTFYRGLGLPWVPDLLDQQRLAGVVWLVGQVALIPILVVGVARARGSAVSGAKP